MEICTFASGSSGNCALVSCGSTHILVDAGISLRRISQNLGFLGLAPEMLDGILITHEHSDHVNALKMITKYHKLPIYASHGVASYLYRAMPEVCACINEFAAGEEFLLKSLTVKSFSTPHDASESVGFRFEFDGKTLAFITDLGFVPDAVIGAVQGADTVVLESNHDIALLKSGGYPYYLKKRILAKHGHLSNDDCGAFAALLARSGTKRIILAHLSRENNTPELAFKTVAASLSAAGITAGQDVHLHVAPANEIGSLYIV